MRPKKREAMSSLRLILLVAALMLAASGAAVAQSPLTALARLQTGDSAIIDSRDGRVSITLTLSQPVPWRAFTLDAPRRLVLDFSEVVWPPEFASQSAQIPQVRTGVLQPGWSRMVLDLATHLKIETASLETNREDGRAVLKLRLGPQDAETFAETTGAPPNPVFAQLPPSSVPSPPQPRGPQDPLHVMLDPGHGGIDPGAEVGPINEADLMLTFARELRELLLRSGGFEVSLTRQEDVFVPLETRITLARAAGAHVMISLHADALAEEAGNASGATVYLLSDAASDRASQRLAERHDQSDLLAGVDLSGQSDEIALVLMDLARTETEPRSQALAGALVQGISAEVGRMNSRPLRRAGFSVLKAPDIPSVLIELGFLSSPRDRERLTSPEWRMNMASGIRDALRRWSRDDLIRAGQIRN
ncbi:MAG: N-acetylmuramoyl-L-alanine amidase [Alphaproteobacteria bacterium]|nr:N-acetylmuramoyl-L-alanine amidase [Alphaproteobacteria bacterium]NNF24500.1 N-acetylmuramoyl-L-alanine amidase [Paracoccaceae bacterium]